MKFSLVFVQIGWSLLLFSLYGQVNPADAEHFSCMVKLWFIFSLIWSVCGSVDEDGRKKIDNFLREIEGTFPNKVHLTKYQNTFFLINVHQLAWISSFLFQDINSFSHRSPTEKQRCRVVNCKYVFFSFDKQERPKYRTVCLQFV